MADTQFISKNQLISLIRKVVGAQKTGLISILTDTQHAVLLKFAEGKLIHSYSRGRDIGDVIQVLNECNFIKFNFAPIPMENAPELMPVVTFIQLLEAGNSYDVEPDSSPTIPNAVAVAQIEGFAENNKAVELLRRLLVNIASEYVGPIADMMVDEAFENSSDAAQVIEYIAEMIPDAKQSAEFRAEAHQGTHLVSL